MMIPNLAIFRAAKLVFSPVLILYVLPRAALFLRASKKSLDRMQQNEKICAVGNNFDERICGHLFCINVKCFSTVRQE